MEAHEALVAGVLGVATLFAHGRRRDPVDRILAVVLLWICVTGILGLLLAQLDDPWRYVRMALRLTGPVALLVVCEESVRTATQGGTRRNSLIFAAVLWGLGVGGLIYRQGRALVDISLDPVGLPLQMGVTAWMGLLLICSVGALLSVVPAGFRGIKPGFAGIAAFLLLASEMWAALDPRWSTGEVGPLSYRTLFTLGLAGVAVVKALSAGFEISMSSASYERPKPKKDSDEGEVAAEEEETPADDARSSKGKGKGKGKGNARKGGSKSGKKRKK